MEFRLLDPAPIRQMSIDIDGTGSSKGGVGKIGRPHCDAVTAHCHTAAEIVVDFGNGANQLRLLDPAPIGLAAIKIDCPRVVETVDRCMRRANRCQVPVHCDIGTEIHPAHRIRRQPSVQIGRGGRRNRQQEARRYEKNNAFAHSSVPLPVEDHNPIGSRRPRFAPNHARPGDRRMGKRPRCAWIPETRAFTEARKSPPCPGAGRAEIRSGSLRSSIAKNHAFVTIVTPTPFFIRRTEPSSPVFRVAEFFFNCMNPIQGQYHIQSRVIC